MYCMVFVCFLVPELMCYFSSPTIAISTGTVPGIHGSYEPFAESVSFAKCYWYFFQQNMLIHSVHPLCGV